jgi:hypothetical protein
MTGGHCDSSCSASSKIGTSASLRDAEVIMTYLPLAAGSHMSNGDFYLRWNFSDI